MYMKTCPACGGERYEKCEICDGSGKTATGFNCWHCNGSGRIPCDRCDGAGEIPENEN